MGCVQSSVGSFRSIQMLNSWHSRLERGKPELGSWNLGVPLLDCVRICLMYSRICMTVSSKYQVRVMTQQLNVGGNT